MDKMMGEFQKRSKEHEQQMLLISKVYNKQDRILQYETEETAVGARIVTGIDRIENNGIKTTEATRNIIKKLDLVNQKHEEKALRA